MALSQPLVRGLTRGLSLPLVLGGEGAPPVVAAPVFTTQPTLDASSYFSGDTVTLTEGVTDVTATLVIETFTVGGVDRSAEIAGLTWSGTVVETATISYRVSATSADGTTLSSTITATISPTIEQALTQSFTIPNGAIATGNEIYGHRGEPVVMACDLVLPAAPSEGIVFHLGGSTRGCYTGIRPGGALLRVRAGTGPEIADNGTLDNVAILDVPVSSLPFDGELHNLVWEMDPVNDTVSLWIDNVLIGTASDPNSNMGSTGEWAGTGAGLYLSGTDANQMSGESYVAWPAQTNASDLRVYENQSVSTP